MSKEKELNMCKCGSDKYPNIDSDDMIPCWMVTCWDCDQKAHAQGSSWTYFGAVNEWNKNNPVTK